MKLAGPDADQERWLTLAARLRGSLPPDAVSARAGGWKITGPFARIALFVLGALAAVMLAVVLGFGSESMLIFSGAAAVVAAEWLKTTRRLHASGFEEGLYLGGCFMAAFWIVDQSHLVAGTWSSDAFSLSIILATGIAGLRLLNPFLTTCSAVVALDWLASTRFAHAIDDRVGGGFTEIALACVVALAALALGSREIRRPSHDRMLDWLVVTMPIGAYVRHASIGWFGSFAALSYIAPMRYVVCALLAVVAATLLYAGLKRRRHAPLLGCLACLACLAVELRAALGGAVEAWLVIAGLVTIAASAAIERLLRDPHDGLTSVRLTDREGPLDLLQSAGAAILVQADRPDAPPPESEHAGQFGGGGASGNF